MTDDIVLYDSPGSPCARRVRIVLLEKGLAWTTRLVDLTKLEQKRLEQVGGRPSISRSLEVPIVSRAAR